MFFYLVGVLYSRVNGKKKKENRRQPVCAYIYLIAKQKRLIPSNTR